MNLGSIKFPQNLTVISQFFIKNAFFPYSIAINKREIENTRSTNKLPTGIQNRTLTSLYMNGRESFSDKKLIH